MIFMFQRALQVFRKQKAEQFLKDCLTTLLVFVLVFGNIADLINTPPKTAHADTTSVRQEINITDAYLGAASGSHATSSAIVNIDTTKYSDATYYFEAVASTTSSFAATIYLKNATTFATVATINIPTNTTTYTRLRSDAFTPTTGAADYVVVMGNEAVHKGAIATRVVILQASLTRTQTQIEIGNHETGKTNTATAALSQPKYWYFDSTKWDGTLEYSAEVTYKVSPVASSTTYDVSATTTTTESNYVGSSNVGYVQIQAWGPGGGGDGVSSGSTIGGGGGGGGAYAAATTTSTAGSVNRVHVGRGGAEGTQTTASSTFINAAGT